jgi:hypothetical protein
LRLSWADGATSVYQPFVYGRPGPRRVVHTSPDGHARELSIDEGNAFEALFAVPRSEWRATQTMRLERMRALTQQLERLGSQLARYREAVATGSAGLT